MIYIPTSKVIELTGLSAVVLREWTRRRALIPADIPAAGKGKAAKYSWETVLVIRIANQLKEEFHVQLQAHAVQFTALREIFSKRSFLALYGAAVICNPGKPWRIVRADETRTNGACLTLPLQHHLDAICGAFGQESSQARAPQFDLFPATEIKTGQASAHLERRDVGQRQA